ncbi:hypothetical protein Nepgr_003731 [Nepenthes gracilis]|uniref:Uncharacterized protein n=1 Tax=Nepenthes gracilis TaxID=150966 RepID=A0AAD3S050_NEPGR|nr:hypothetical protein Nepgr_003731 [Nepenthes gracilis]
MEYFTSNTSRVMRTTPAPLPMSVDDPPTWSTHSETSSCYSMFSGGYSSRTRVMVSTVKSARACAFMVGLGRNSMSNLPNSIAHFTNRQEIGSHVRKGLDFLWVCLDPLLGDYETQECFRGYPKDALSQIQLHLVLTEHLKRLCQITDMVASGSALNEHIVNINFHIAADLFLKYFIYQPLVGGSYVLDVVGHYLIAIGPDAVINEALLMSVKSTHNCHFPLLFFTRTTLESYCSLMNSASNGWRQLFYRVVYPLPPDELSIQVEAQLVDNYSGRNPKHVGDSPCEDVLRT